MITYLKKTINSIIYRLNPVKYKSVIWLIGSSRSGTTWVTSIININNNYRELFEPFHTFHPEMRKFGFRKNLFLDDSIKMKKFRKLAELTFKGKYYQKDIEVKKKSIFSQNKDYIVIKDVFANLIAYNFCQKNKKIKPILLIRNPFAVVDSIIKKKDCDWMTDPSEFLLQKELSEKLLKPFKEIISDISENGSYFEKQFLIRSIINYVPLKQFKEEELLVTFYEDWISNPTKELIKTYNYVGINTTNLNDISNHNVIKTPSRTATEKVFKVNSWEERFSEKEISQGIKILQYFGLENLYNKNSEPNIEAIRNLK